MEPAERRVELQPPGGSTVHRDHRDQAQHAAGETRQSEDSTQRSSATGELPGGGAVGRPRLLQRGQLVAVEEQEVGG